MSTAKRTEVMAIVLLLVGACDDGPAELANDAGDVNVDPGANAPARDASGGDAPPELNGATDRCFTEGCAPAMLPAQPEIPFLADAGDGWQRLIQADWQLARDVRANRPGRRQRLTALRE